MSRPGVPPRLFLDEAIRVVRLPDSSTRHEMHERMTCSSLVLHRQVFIYVRPRQFPRPQSLSIRDQAEVRSENLRVEYVTITPDRVSL